MCTLHILQWQQALQLGCGLDGLEKEFLVGGRVFVDGHQNGQFLAPNWREVTQQSGIGLLLAVH